MNKCIIMLAGLLTACVSTQQVTLQTPLWKNRADMIITVDGKTFAGMAATKAGSTDISIVSQAPLDLLRITTCHRDFTVEKADPGWFGGSGKTYTYHYDPKPTELSKFCPMYIQAFSENSVTDWGYVAFRTDETMPAHMFCNGWGVGWAGISVCQTKAGLDQVITFDRDVLFEADPVCQVTASSKREFTFRSIPGFCYAEFSDGKVWHRLVLLGYDSVLVRGE